MEIFIESEYKRRWEWNIKKAGIITDPKKYEQGREGRNDIVQRRSLPDNTIG